MIYQNLDSLWYKILIYISENSSQVILNNFLIMAKKKSIISLIYQFKSIILSNIHQVKSPRYCLLNQPKKVSTIGFLIIVSSIYCWPHSKLFLNSKASFKETSLLTSRSMICFGEILIVKIPLKD